MEFPNLFKMNKQGTKWLVWKLRVEGDPSGGICKIVREHGTEDGKMVLSAKEVKSGKNKGRKNETTIFQQACADAQSMWTKQIELNQYAREKTTVRARPSPMLAHGFDKHAKKVLFPCMVQPKLDGVRMISKVERVSSTGEYKVVCLSRTGKEFDAVPMQYIARDLITLVTRDNKELESFYFDGELFSPEMLFEDIVSACRTSVGHDEAKFKHLHYHVYDLIPTEEAMVSMPYEDRFGLLTSLRSGKYANLRLVEAMTIYRPEDIPKMHDVYVEQGYEGIMVRNRKGAYLSNRSYDLQKYKHFTDEEYEIVDAREATGNDAGTAILQCRMGNGDDRSFWVRPKGTREYRTSLLTNRDALMGKMLTVRYQNLTDKGIPRFPVGMAVRDYE